MIYKGRFNQIKQGEINGYDLALLADNLIKKDCVNFDIDNVGLGFTSALANTLIKYIPEDKNTNILIINGITLELYNILKDRGYNNVTLAFGSWNKEKQNYIDNDKDTFEIMREYIQNNFEDDISISVIKLEEIFDMSKKFDLIISNPPYAIGNEITKNIIDKVEFNQFVNLMPLSKYKKNNLYKYVGAKLGRSSCAEGNQNFEDAYTDPLICAIQKKENPEFTNYKDFEMKLCYDNRLSKFWGEQLRRNPPFIRHDYIVSNKHFNLYNSKTSFSCGIYTPHDKVHAINHLKEKYNNINLINSFLNDPNKKLSRDCSEEYIWNIIKVDAPYNKVFLTTNNGTTINQTVTVFKSEVEADNFKQWWYSAEANNKNEKSGLASILLAAMNKPTGCPFDYAIPYVDWTHPWTDEEILRDYGYTEKEIEYILSFGKFNLYRHSLEDYEYTEEEIKEILG